MNIKTFSLSLNQWAITLIMFIALPILIAQYFLNYSFFEGIQQAHNIQRFNDLTNKAQALLLFPVASSEELAIKNIAKELMKDEEIRAIHIKDANNDTLFHQEVDGFLNDRNENVIRKEVLLLDNRPVIEGSIFGIDSPENIVYGKVILYLATNKNDEIVTQQLQNRSIQFTILIIVIAFLVYMVTRKSHKHALRIHSHILAILNGNYDHETKLSSVSELSKISLGLNELGNTLHDKMQDLEQSREKAVEARESVEKAAYFKDEFIHIISHEIRTPVNTITNLIDILESHLSHGNIDEVAMMHYKVCRDASRDLRSIVDELVDFDKLERTDVELNLSVCDVKQFFESIKLQNITTYKGKSISFNLINPDSEQHIDLDTIYIDSGKLKQISTNLIDNAYKYTDTGSITLKWFIEDDDSKSKYLHILCKDSGIGIPDNSLENIFEPFYQVQKKRYYSYSGYGLGLSIVKKLVNAMSGTIEVSSKVDVGTTFRVIIPIQISTQTKQINDIAKIPVKNKINSYTIDAAVIDDDKNNCYTLTAMLKEHGISCRSFTDPEVAIKELPLKPVDVIFIDLHMTNIDGFHTAKCIKENIRGKTQTLICVTADTHKSVSQSISDSAMDGLIFKPINMTDLINVIDSVEVAKNVTNNLILQGTNK
ncbi:MAG: hybrid sensor histidine kinase/response regulator [Pseudomonadota bacterium]